jgi:hypothetical protein
MKTMKMYLYLARRNKSQVRLLTILSGTEYPATRLTDVKKLGLPSGITAKLTAYIHENRMSWEPWIESAENFAELRKKLTARGFEGFPLSSSPVFEAAFERVSSQLVAPKIKTMLRKPKS